MRLDRWDVSTDHALWLRAAERIDVPAGGVVPGPLDDDPPAPARPLADPVAAAEGWRWWWSAIVTPAADDPAVADGPEAWAARAADRMRRVEATAALAPWPELAAAAAARFREFHAWHTARQSAGLQRHGPGDDRDGRVVRELERRLGGSAPPFVVEVLVLPVRDDEVRPVGPDRYLVPEHIYDGPDWSDHLEALLLPRFG